MIPKHQNAFSKIYLAKQSKVSIACYTDNINDLNLHIISTVKIKNLLLEKGIHIPWLSSYHLLQYTFPVQLCSTDRMFVMCVKELCSL